MRFGLRYRINKRPKVDCYPSSSILNTSPLPSTSIELKGEKRAKEKSGQVRYLAEGWEKQLCLF